VRAFKASLMETTARNGDRTLSPASIPKNLTALRSVLAWAVGQGYVENNPATGITHAGAKRAQWESGRLLTILTPHAGQASQTTAERLTVHPRRRAVHCSVPAEHVLRYALDGYLAVSWLDRLAARCADGLLHGA
jgi:hypothetical protein